MEPSVGTSGPIPLIQKIGSAPPQPWTPTPLFETTPRPAPLPAPSVLPVPASTPPVAVPSLPIASVPTVPQPVVNVAVFESKPGHSITLTSGTSIGTITITALVVLTITIVFLYIWGAHLEQERMLEEAAVVE